MATHKATYGPRPLWGPVKDAMRILIVEDEAIIAFSMDDALSSAGHTVVGIARDEDTAAFLAAAYHPDLALVDLRLARGSSGATAAQLLRERHGIPSIFVSGNPLDCRKVSSHVGVLGCLSKPFNDEELKEAVTVAETILAGQSPAHLPNGLELYVVL